jgi:RNA polymerase sigma factor (sigma-70 family)
MFESTTFTPVQGDEISDEQMAEHEGLVRWVVRQQWLGDLPFADALHEGRLGLWHALRHYDPTRDTAFSTYAVVAIARSVWRAVVANHTSCAGIRPGGHSPCLFRDDETDLTELVHQAQVHTALLELVDQLPPRLRQIVILHHGLDGALPLTFAAIGKMMGSSREISRQRTHQLHLAALLWLAHPAHSLLLRRLLDRHTRSDYQKTAARQRKVAQSYRRSRRGGARR